MDRRSPYFPHFLVGQREKRFNITGSHMRISALQVQFHLYRIYPGELAGDPDKHLACVCACLFLSSPDSLGDRIIHQIRVVPSGVRKTVIACYSRAYDVCALTACYFGNKRNDFARAKIDDRDRASHQTFIPISLAFAV